MAKPEQLIARLRAQTYWGVFDHVAKAEAFFLRRSAETDVLQSEIQGKMIEERSSENDVVPGDAAKARGQDARQRTPVEKPRRRYGYLGTKAGEARRLGPATDNWTASKTTI